MMIRIIGWTLTALCFAAAVANFAVAVLVPGAALTAVMGVATAVCGAVMLARREEWE